LFIFLQVELMTYRTESTNATIFEKLSSYIQQVCMTFYIGMVVNLSSIVIKLCCFNRVCLVRTRTIATACLLSRNICKYKLSNNNAFNVRINYYSDAFRYIKYI
jgi:hypothetical protein